MKREFNENQRYEISLYARNGRQDELPYYRDMIQTWIKENSKLTATLFSVSVSNYYSKLYQTLEIAEKDINNLYEAAEAVENEYAAKFEEIAFEMKLYASRITSLRNVLTNPVSGQLSGNTFRAADFAERLADAKTQILSEEIERQIALAQSYAGAANSAGYQLSAYYHPKNLLKYITVEQYDIYNQATAGGNYTDEQKCRMLLSLALCMDVNDLLAMEDDERLIALKDQMEQWNQNDVDHEKVAILLEVKWSEVGYEYLHERLNAHFEQIIFSNHNSAGKSIADRINEAYQKLPRKYDQLFDGYGIPKLIKQAVTYVINNGEEKLDKVAMVVLGATMAGDAGANIISGRDNITNNQQYTVAEYIDDQKNVDVAKIQMGVHTADYNGCGWIATYNIMHMLGKDMQPWEIVNYYETVGGALIGGRFGVNPTAIEGFFNTQGIKTSTDYFPASVDELIKNSGMAIFNYVHNNGAHYIAVEYDNGKFITYNDTKENTALAEASIDTWIQDKEWLPLSITTFN